MRKIFFALFCLSFTFMLKAQSVKVNEDPIVSKMMLRMAQINQFQPSVEGWRIQILATTDRRKLEEVKTKFQAKYPLISVDWTHEKPYYKLKAGAFATKLEAARLLHQLKKDYPGAYTAKDNRINPRELIGS
ncbi:MAG: SPOR domain-containing protein [Bacteroidota bacterium]